MYLRIAMNTRCKFHYKSGFYFLNFPSNVNKETIFTDGFESMSTWDKTNNSFGHSLTALDTTKKKSGRYSGRIDDNYPANWEKYVYSDTWTPINNSQDTYYTVSGWIYVENVANNDAQIWLSTRKSGETGYPSGNYSSKTTQRSRWEYLSKTVLVPADVRELNIRIDNNKKGKVWFDDVKIVKGNTSQTVIVEESNYYPFGLEHKGYNNVVNGVEHKYETFNGKELDESLGLNVIEMDWRQYDPAIGRFNVVDPMAEERDWLSPYNFTQNNPILRVDPTGLLDDYGIDKSGNIELIKKTDDKTDTLYAVNTNENGEKVIDESKGSVTVDKQKDGSSVVSDLADNKVSSKYLEADDIERTASETIAVAGESSKDDVFKVFKFAADNSNVEWSVNKLSVNGSNRYQIGTNFSGNYSPGYKGVGKWLGMVHSHPNEPTSKGRSESLYGDLSVGANYLSKYGKKLPYLVYFPNTGKTTKMRTGKTATGKTAAKKPIRGLKNFKF